MYYHLENPRRYLHTIRMYKIDRVKIMRKQPNDQSYYWIINKQGVSIPYPRYKRCPTTFCLRYDSVACANITMEKCDFNWTALKSRCNLHMARKWAPPTYFLVMEQYSLTDYKSTDFFKICFRIFATTFSRFHRKKIIKYHDPWRWKRNRGGIRI